MKVKEENRGITLVALVITIIILLILAGISITQLTGSGLFEKARLAKEKSGNAQIEEDSILNDYENEINKYIESTREDKKDNISLEEKAIGTWINGETIYAKTIYVESMPNSSTAVEYNHNINNVKLIWIDVSKSFMVWNAGAATAPFQVMSLNDRSVVALISGVTENSFSIRTDTNRSGASAYVTLNYIKNNE